MKLYAWIGIICFFSTTVLAANEPLTVGGRVKGMSNISVSVVDFWSIANNPAVMPFYGKLSVGIAYENRFLLKETSNAVFGMSIPAGKAGAFGFCMNHFGGNNYGQFNAGLSYSLSFAKVFSFGLKFNYLMEHFGSSEYPARHGFTFDVGMYGQVTPQFSLGFFVSNPARLRMQTYNDIKEYLPTVFRLGAGYKFGQKFLLAAELEKNLEARMQGNLGAEYVFADYLSIKAGLRVPDFQFTVGIGTKFKGLSIDFASTYQLQLGYCPQISLHYDIK
ncbi:MAG: type IX secretion system membrane protein PorP/SprF [Bacteroidales bacterium]|jgi:hypothetical protein|nr:type IX secretion system membrane protein PorP/SprF [Bacteroidales bacterium]